MYAKEKKYWADVLERLIEIVKFLGTQNLAFRGSSDTLYQKDNGNFLKLIELFAKFDPIMKSHIERALHEKNSVHYLSKDSQNEILEILGAAIRDKVLSHIRNAKYYSLILDCTPDAGKTEQMSIICRFVSISEEKVEVKENFLGFVAIFDSKSQGLYDTITKMLKMWNIPLENMRGQGYDNGANMKGKKNGLQSMFLKVNPRAFFVPCSAHTLNLTINDASKVNSDTISFFSVVNEIYIFFSASSKRWTILKNNVSNLTLKQPSDTRWESRIDAVRPLRYQLGEIYDALYEIMENESFAAEVQHEARSLCGKIKDFKFICSLVVWHDILNRINPVSKLLQEKNMNITLVLESIEKLKIYLLEYRSDSNYQELLETAKTISEDVEGDSQFKSSVEIRKRKKKRMFEYENEDESPQSPEDKFRINVFYTILDTSVASLNERFEQLYFYNINFGFLNDFMNIDDKYLKNKCKNLESLLTFNSNKDINGTELFEEILAFKDIFGLNNQNPIEILNFLNRNHLPFPNLAIALRILLTIPVSVASSERSFSKLKLIKTYLRSSMSQERLVNLAMISIESNICNELDIKELISTFINLKTRKI